MDTDAAKPLTFIGGFLYNMSPPHLHSVLKMMSLNSEMDNQIVGQCNMKYVFQSKSKAHMEAKLVVL